MVLVKLELLQEKNADLLSYLHCYPAPYALWHTLELATCLAAAVVRILIALRGASRDACDPSQGCSPPSLTPATLCITCLLPHIRAAFLELKISGEVFFTSTHFDQSNSWSQVLLSVFAGSRGKQIGGVSFFIYILA